MNISIVTCAHNPRPQFPTRVIEAPQAQSLPRDEWELLLIDNKSTEPLGEALAVGDGSSSVWSLDFIRRVPR